MHDSALPRGLEGWPLHLVGERLSEQHHGDFARWRDAVRRLPALAQASVSLGDTVTVTGATDDELLRECLLALHPWRKGPFRIGATRIDSEWRSDLKWRRLAPLTHRLTGARVLDIGCGNGYFGWRMLEAGAREVIGIDPSILFCMQHRAIERYAEGYDHHVLPLAVEEIPATTEFDAVFSMGVVYHRKAPAEHVAQLHALTAPGGLTVLESLVTPGDTDLVPADRYARMRNVWRVPAVKTLEAWMSAAGFDQVRVIDVTPTTAREQRTTAWMRFESLAEALARDDPGKTVEGHPAPIRAIVVGEKAA